MIIDCISVIIGTHVNRQFGVSLAAYKLSTMTYKGCCCISLRYSDNVTPEYFWMLYSKY